MSHTPLPLLGPQSPHHTTTTRHQVPGTRHQTPDTRHQTPGTRHQTPDTRHQTPDTNTNKTSTCKQTSLPFTFSDDDSSTCLPPLAHTYIHSYSFCFPPLTPSPLRMHMLLVGARRGKVMQGKARREGSGRLWALGFVGS